MFSAMLYILLTHSLWRWNPSRCGLTTKPLPSHLQGADSPTPTAQNCTFHRAEQRASERERERGERYCSSADRIKNRHTNVWLHVQDKRKSITLQSWLTVACVQHNLLDSHGSESNILPRRPPASVRVKHQPEHAF